MNRIKARIILDLFRNLYLLKQILLKNFELKNYLPFLG